MRNAVNAVPTVPEEPHGAADLRCKEPRRHAGENHQGGDSVEVRAVVPTWPVGDSRALEADLAAEQTQLEAGPSHHPRFQQQIPGAGPGKTVGHGEFRIRLTLDGARLDV